MSQHTASVAWKRGDEPFTDSKYSRRHSWSFDGGQEIQASASPHVVREPYSDPAGVDPEEALLAAIASCHMLTFLHLAAKKGFVIDAYKDACVGVLEKNAKGRLAITKVTLKPMIAWGGDKKPTAEEIEALHHASHAECFIANSVCCEIGWKSGPPVDD